MNNPYTASFGQLPQQYIPRPEQTDLIIETFAMENPTTHTYMITGVRGTGKTVALTTVSQYFSTQKDWVVLNLSPDAELLQSAVSKLTDEALLRKVFAKADVSLSVMGVVTVKEKQTIIDADTQLRKILEYYKKKKKKILFVIDEMVKNDNTKLFASCFQIYLREDYPVYLLMAGLFDNINNLQNEKTLTFLYRAPKIILEPLSTPAIARNYQRVLKIDIERAARMARMTNGYPFAFQTLGYLAWEHDDVSPEELLAMYDESLATYVYDKLWSELSAKDREVVLAITDGMTKMIDIRAKMNMTPQLLNVYKKRLVNQGIVDDRYRGEMHLALPRFDEYVRLYGVIEF